jgi:epoxyqueuosine reductase
MENRERCNYCLFFRTKNTVDYALKYKYDFVSSTFVASRYKNAELVKKTFIDLTRNTNVKFFDILGDKNYFYTLGVKLCKKYNIYRQKYCGCEFSKNIQYD